MDNDELHIILKKLVGTYFDSVFARGNKIGLKNNRYYVFNTEIWPKTGHFIALYCCGLNIYVFDSLGVNNISHEDFLCQKTPNMIYLNNKKLQSDYSTVCALYCIFFVYYANSGKSFKFILSHFTMSQDRNDRVLYVWYLKNAFFRKYKQINILDTNHIENVIRQVCEL